jgi:uncharacterized protein with HEPN domain
MKRHYKLFLDDIRKFILDIESYMKGVSQNEFMNNQFIQDAVIRKIEIIGEATKNIPKSLKEKNPHIPWEDMGRFRNFITHSYYEMSIKRVWNIVKIDLPLIKEGMRNVKLV